MTEQSTRRQTQITLPHCRLRVLEGPERGKQVSFRRRQIRIGRNEKNDFVLQDPSVSGHHVTLRHNRELGGYQLIDEDSTNGVWLGPVRIFEASLTAQTSLQIGDVVIELSPEDEPISKTFALPTEIDPTGTAQFFSEKMLDIFGTITCLAGVEVPVVFLGETGTGKGTLAQQLHKLSARSEKPFVHVNCAAIPTELFEAQLFGYRKGAFTGASREHDGFFQQAHGGTLFLDEISELSLEQQSKLLLALDKGEFYPVGADNPVQVDIRLLTATNRDLLSEMEEGRFREDLYYRIVVYEIHVPPLRERREDIDKLASLFLQKFLQENPSHRPLSFSASAKEVLLHYEWPGNVRQLQNIVFAAATRSAVRSSHTHRQIEVEDMPAMVRLHSSETKYQAQASVDSSVTRKAGTGSFGMPFPSYDQAKKDALAEFQRQYLLELFAIANQNVTQASRISGLNRTHIYTLKKELGID